MENAPPEDQVTGPSSRRAGAGGHLASPAAFATPPSWSEPPSPPKRTGLWIGVGILVGVIVSGFVVLAVVLRQDEGKSTEVAPGQTTTTPSTRSTPPTPARQTIEEFLKIIASGNPELAEGMLCPDATPSSKDAIKEATSVRASLRLTKSRSSSSITIATVDGTANGKSAAGAIKVTDSSSTTYCVADFRVSF